MTSRNQKNYRLTDAYTFVTRLQSRGALEVSARKSGCVIARPAVPGENIITYTENGNLESQVPGIEGKMVLTRCDREGNPIVDEYGHLNQWQTDHETFEKKYAVEDMRPDGFVRPRGSVQRFIRVDEDIAILVPWGENGAPVEQTIDAGGWLNITDPGNIYGIADAEFQETYEIIQNSEFGIQNHL